MLKFYLHIKRAHIFHSILKIFLYTLRCQKFVFFYWNTVISAMILAAIRGEAKENPAGHRMKNDNPSE